MTETTIDRQAEWNKVRFETEQLVREIAAAKGPYDRNRLKHAENTIVEMQTLAEQVGVKLELMEVICRELVWAAEARIHNDYKEARAKEAEAQKGAEQ